MTTELTVSFPALTLIVTNVIMLVSIYVKITVQMTKNATRLDSHEKRLDLLEEKE